MRAEDRRTALALAFRETAPSLIGLFQIYEVEPEVADAAAEVLGRLFRRHLDQPPERCGRERCRPMHALVDELDRVWEIIEAAKASGWKDPLDLILDEG